MQETRTYEELVEQLQEGHISYLEFILMSDQAEDYQEWCKTHGTEPSEESAEFYIEQTDIDQMERQIMDDEDYGIW